MQVTNIKIDKEHRETTQHGTPSFPVAVYHSVMSRNVLGYTNWHWHAEMQFCQVTEGAIRFFVNGQQYLMQKGEGIFINGNLLHMSKPEGGPESAYICVDVAPRLLGSFPGSVFEEKYLLPYLQDPRFESVELRRDVPWQASLLEGITRVYVLSEREDFGWELELLASLNRMWLTLLKHRSGAPAKTPGRSRDHAVVQAILTYIDAHYNERITIEALAEDVRFSPGACCRVFKRVTGETIFSYLQAYRLEKAVELLQSPDLPVEEVAYAVGFCSASYFIKQFKKQMDTTPLKYRKEHL